MGLAARLAWILPLAVALLVHVPSVRTGFVLDDAALEARRSELLRLDPRFVFFESYVSPYRVDAGYRPLAYWTIALQNVFGGAAWQLHLANVGLHAAASVLVYFLLREVLGGKTSGAAPALAAAGAAIFAVHPVTVDAVARITGRADLLAGLGVFAAWLLALRAAPTGAGAPERPGLAAAAGLVTFTALFAKEGTAYAIPFVILAGAWLLDRRVPRAALAASVLAILGYWAVRGVVLEDRPGLTSTYLHPLRLEEPASRALNSLRLLGLYAAKLVAPWQLSAEYSRLDAPVLSTASLWAWIVASILILVPLGASVFACRRGRPIVALAMVLFAAAVIPSLHFVAPAKTYFAERCAYAASLALPLALAALAAPLAGRRMRAMGIAAAALAAVFGLRTLVRNEDWVSGDVARLIPVRETADYSHRLFLAFGEVSDEIASRGDSSAERIDLRERVQAEADRILKNRPDDGWAEGLKGHILYQQGQYAEAVQHLSRAATSLAAESPPVQEPLIFQLRGDAYLILEKPKEAFTDLDLYIQLEEAARRLPLALTYSRRGLSRAKLGDLEGALKDFTTAISLDQGLSELYNNRGFTRYKLGDFDGAIEDYKQAYEICRKKNVYYTEVGDSMHGFLLRIADVYDKAAKKHAQNQNEALVRFAAGEAARFKAEADKLAPAKAKP